MRILHRSGKRGRLQELKLLAENLDDLWYLYNLISEGDLVFAVGFRTEDKATDKLRPEKREKKRMKIGLRVESLEFHEFSDRLRVHGVIEDAARDLGLYHTFNIVEGAKLSIIKEGWKQHELDCVREAEEGAKRPIVTFVAIEDDNATIAILRQYGIQNIASISATGTTGKQYRSSGAGKGKGKGKAHGKQAVEEFYGQVLVHLEQLDRSGRSEGKGSAGVGGAGLGNLLVILGPGFVKEAFNKFGKTRNPALFKGSLILGTGHGGMTGVQEALKRGIVKQVGKESRVGFETRLVERILEEISKDGLVAYGVQEVLEALNAGAVETLLVTTTLIRGKKADAHLDLAKQTNVATVVISPVHEAGKKLDSLGGTAALLRYKIANF